MPLRRLLPLLPAIATAWMLSAASPVLAQRPGRGPAEAPRDGTQTLRMAEGKELVQLDFDDAELPVVIDTIARMTGKNFIYDDRVRGRVTIVSPSPVTAEQAYAVFESVLQVKGFTTVVGPGGVLKIIPIRDAKESSIETVKDGRASPNRDQFVTRLIPLKYIDAEAITNTVKPLVSKDAAMVAYAPTNTIILTDTQANIRRLLSILEAIDVETYKEELAVIKIRHADASTLGQQISEIYGAEVTGATATPSRTVRRTTRTRPAQTATADIAQRGKVRIITDDRTNSLLILASRSNLEDIRELVRKLDVPVKGGGGIRVYYLRHADAEELSQTLNGLVSGGSSTIPSPGRTGAANAATAQALRAAVTELEGGVTLTADPATNSIIIQGSKEAYETLREVIEQLDIPRPQVLVEALIMEVDVTDNNFFGMNILYEITKGTSAVIQSGTNPDLRSAVLGNIAGDSDGDGDSNESSGDPGLTALRSLLSLQPFVFNITDSVGNGTIRAVMAAAATDNSINILSSPHILTSDNEEAEIKVGDEIPIPTSQTQAPSTNASGAFQTSQNIDRRDIGVTLRVTPQISEGDMLRLEIFQEITAVNQALTEETQNLGASLSKRTVENTVVVADGDTVVIGGLLDENSSVIESKVPFLGDIPVLGWAFKTRARTKTKKNLLVMLTPQIVRDSDELVAQTIRKREEFRAAAAGGLALTKKERNQARELGVDAALYRGGRYPVRSVLIEHAERYPIERMAEIEDRRRERRAERESLEREVQKGPVYSILADVLRDGDEASDVLTELLDAGFEGELVAAETDGVVLFEVRVGPYSDLDRALEAAQVLRNSYRLEPTVTIPDFAARESAPQPDAETETP